MPDAGSSANNNDSPQTKSKNNNGFGFAEDFVKGGDDQPVEGEQKPSYRVTVEDDFDPSNPAEGTTGTVVTVDTKVRAQLRAEHGDDVSIGSIHTPPISLPGSGAQSPMRRSNVGSPHHQHPEFPASGGVTPVKSMSGAAAFSAPRIVIEGAALPPAPDISPRYGNDSDWVGGSDAGNLAVPPLKLDSPNVKPETPSTTREPAVAVVYLTPSKVDKSTRETSLDAALRASLDSDPVVLPTARVAPTLVSAGLEFGQSPDTPAASLPGRVDVVSTAAPPVAQQPLTSTGTIITAVSSASSALATTAAAASADAAPPTAKAVEGKKSSEKKPSWFMQLFAKCFSSSDDVERLPPASDKKYKK